VSGGSKNKFWGSSCLYVTMLSETVLGIWGKGPKRIFLCLGAAAPQATMASHNFLRGQRARVSLGRRTDFGGACCLRYYAYRNMLAATTVLGEEAKHFLGGGVGRCGYVPIAFCICVRLTLSYYDIQELFTV